jgi:hypothetical protein
LDTATEAALSEVNFLGRTGAHLDFYTAPPSVKGETYKISGFMIVIVFSLIIYLSMEPFGFFYNELDQRPMETSDT